MALILKLLSMRDQPQASDSRLLFQGPACRNPHCITTIEPLAPLYFEHEEEPGVRRCVYCETRA